jgi:hypothetical protein
MCSKMGLRHNAMHVHVRRFKSMKIALSELGRYLYQRHLYSGPPFKQLHGLRSREALANWLVCAALNHESRRERYSFTSDQAGDRGGGDGHIYDSAVQVGYPAEHVMALALNPTQSMSVDDRILNAIAKKQEKGGAAYAGGKILVVMLEGGEQRWFPNAVARKLSPTDFASIWVVGFQGIIDGRHIYAAVSLKFLGMNVPTWIIRMAPDFSSWDVQRTQ